MQYSQSPNQSVLQTGFMTDYDRVTQKVAAYSERPFTAHKIGQYATKGPQSPFSQKIHLQELSKISLSPCVISQKSDQNGRK